MFKRISIALLCLPLLGFGIIPISGRRDAAPPAGNIEDDFSGDMSKWTKLSGTDWEIHGGGYFQVNGGASYPYTDEQTSTISQWVQVEYYLLAAYAGIYLRSTNNASEIAYAARMNSRTAFAWRYCTGHTCTDIGTATIPSISDGDYLGVEVTGTGNSTVVKVWDLGPTPPARGSWGTADATLTDNPNANKADTGKYVGLYFGGSGGGQYWDNFSAGDI